MIPSFFRRRRVESMLYAGGPPRSRLWVIASLMVAMLGIVGAGVAVHAVAPAQRANVAVRSAVAVPSSSKPVVRGERALKSKAAERLTRRGAPIQRERAGRAERVRSRSVLRGASRAELLKAGRRHFSDVFSGRLFDGRKPDPQMTVVGYRGETRAMVKDADGRKLLLKSTLPLRARTTNGVLAPVDLSLRESSQTFTTANSNADVQIAKDPADGIRFLKEGFSISDETTAGSAQPDGVQADGRVFFDDASGADVSFVVVPKPTGVEVGWLLATADAPQRYTLKLPDGARVRRTQTDDPIPGDPPRTFEIVDQAGKSLAHITPPMTLDSDGVNVESSMRIVGRDRLVIDAKHHGQDVRYPLFLDPEVFVPRGRSPADWQGWGTYQTPTTPTRIAPDYNHNYYGWALDHHAYYPYGAYMSMPTHTWFNMGTGRGFEYRAPEGTYVSQATFGNMLHGAMFPGGTYDVWWNGILNSTRSAWQHVWTGYHNAVGATHTFGAGRNEQNYANMGIGAAAANYNGYLWSGTSKAMLTLDWANVYVADPNPPQLTSPHPANQDWSSATSRTQTVTGSDYGTGLSGFRLTSIGAGIDKTVSSTGGPTNIHYTPAEGSHSYTLTAIDVASGTSNPQTWTEKIDRTAPTIEPTGSLKSLDTTTDDSGVDLYHLTVVARDGDPAGSDAARRAGVRDVSVTVAGKEIARATSDPSCVDSCKVTIDATEFDTDTVAEGAHQVKVVAYDRLNHRSEISWTIHVVRDNYYASKLAAWQADVQSRVDQANPLPLSEPMPAPPTKWQDIEGCEQDAAHLGACFDANQAWGRSVAAWLESNPMLTTSFGSLPLPPTFEYARSRTAVQLTRGTRAAFQSAEPDTENPTRLLRVVLGFHAPVSRSQLLTLIPALDLQSGVELKGVFDPGGANISMGYRSADALGLAVPLPLGTHLDNFYQEQSDQNDVDVAQFQQELAGDVDGDPAEADDATALQEALDGELALQPVLQAKGKVISGLSANMTLTVLNTLLTTTAAPIKALRILPATTAPRDPDGPLEDPLNDMLTDAEAVAQSVAVAQPATPPAGAAARSASGISAAAATNVEGVPAPPGDKRTCGQLYQKGYDSAASHTEPYSISYRVALYGYASADDPQGLVRKRASMGFRWTGDNLAWYCGDDPHDRGFEPETKVQETAGPRWGVDQQNYGWKSNMPSPYLDDLNGGLENGFKKDRFPDFAIGTANARALKYNTLYYTRNIIDKGETNSGYVVARGTPTRRPSVPEKIYCYGKAQGRDSGCYFRERTCTVGVDQVPMSRSRRYKLGWSQQQATDKCFR